MLLQLCYNSYSLVILVFVLNKEQFEIVILCIVIISLSVYIVVSSGVITYVVWLLATLCSHFIDIIILFEASIKVLDLCLQIIYLAHIHTLIKQMLSFNFVFVHNIAI